MNATFDYRDTPMPLDYFKRKYAVSNSTLWRYRRAGLPSFKVGMKCFVKESAFIAFLEKMNGQTVPADSGQLETKGNA